MNKSQIMWPCTFEGLGNRRFEISVQAWMMMQRFQQIEPQMTEAGGVLLGRHLRDGTAIIVDDITTPLPGDKRSRIRFYRAQHQHQVVIDIAWQTSNGTCTYLGEWHTHPEPVPTPSAIDWADWKRRLRNDQYSEPIFFVIVGTQCASAWEGYRDGRLTQLSLVER